jgi:hypothetical protein
VSNTTLPANLPVSAPGAEKQVPWWLSSLKTLSWSSVYALAGVGIIAVYGTVQVMLGKITPEDIGGYADKIREGWVWLTSTGGTWVAGVFTRYALPAYLQFRREMAAVSEDRLLEKLAQRMGK